MTPTTDLPVPERALAVGAHPDDIEFGCGATLAKWAAAGCQVGYVVCTDGSRGTWDASADLPELVLRRQREQHEAAEALTGSDDVTFLGWPDGELSSGPRQVWQVVYEIRRRRPQVVLGHDPWKRYRLHPDHRHAGFLTVDAVATAREPHAYPEQAASAHRPEALLLFEADEPDHVEVVAEGHLTHKLAALESHRSQFLTTMDVDDDAPDREARLDTFRTRIREELAEQGALVGAKLGEAFKALTDI